MVTKASINEGTAPKAPVKVLINMGRETRKSISEVTKEITKDTREVIVPKRD